MIITAITGGIGSGKSTVANLFAEKKFAIIDADKTAHLITEKNQKAYEDILRLFGDSVLDSNQNIDRRKLAAIVFNDDKRLKELNQITHHYIFDEMQSQVNRLQKNNYNICMDVPLLFQSDFPIEYDASIAVLAPLELRIKRIVGRDGCSESDAQKRIRTQMTEDEYKRYADFVIYNNSNIDELRRQIDVILAKIEGEGYAKKKTT